MKSLCSGPKIEEKVIVMHTFQGCCMCLNFNYTQLFIKSMERIISNNLSTSKGIFISLWTYSKAAQATSLDMVVLNGQQWVKWMVLSSARLRCYTGCLLHPLQSDGEASDKKYCLTAISSTCFSSFLLNLSCSGAGCFVLFCF